MQNKHGWASDSPALAGDGGKKAGCFSCPLGSNTPRRGRKQRKIWQQKHRVSGKHRDGFTQEGNPQGHERESGASSVLPRNHPGPESSAVSAPEPPRLVSELRKLFSLSCFPSLLFLICLLPPPPSVSPTTIRKR